MCKTFGLKLKQENSKVVGNENFSCRKIENCGFPLGAQREVSCLPCEVRKQTYLFGLKKRSYLPRLKLLLALTDKHAQGFWHFWEEHIDGLQIGIVIFKLLRIMRVYQFLTFLTASFLLNLSVKYKVKWCKLS